ncbi:MAG: ACT domain-containing protein, partial [Pseudomonadota bacterium]
PVPGERIIGLRRRGGITVHAASCGVLEAYEDDLGRWHGDAAAPAQADDPLARHRPAAGTERRGQTARDTDHPAARRGGITVHAASCGVLEAYEDDLGRWHDLRWQPDAARRATNLARIMLEIVNEPGTLGRVCMLVGEQHANIANLAVLSRQPESFRMSIDLEVRDLRHLNDILTALDAQSFVTHAGRARDPEIEKDREAVQPDLPLGRAAGE